MSTTSIDSTNWTLAPTTNYQFTMSAGFSNLEVANLTGGGQVSYKVTTDGSTPTCSSNGADTWQLPATAGASRSHVFTETPSALKLAVATSATSHVLVTAW